MKRILLADDDTSVHRLVARALPEYSVTVTHNGLEALALASALPSCDLLITDYLMPALMGDELAGRLRSSRPGLKTLMITGHGDFIGADACQTDARLSKPLQIHELRQTVSRLIGH
jgi:CheY-like chemotaxis protein